MSSKPPSAVRRVVTGHTEEGKAVVVGDDLVGAVTSSLAETFALNPIWGGDAPPTFPDRGERPMPPAYFPPVGGFRFVIANLPPGDRDQAAMDRAVVADLDAKFPGMMAYHEPAEPGMHTTPTIDFELVLSGECSLELDDGVEVPLRQGDAVIQNGTRHRWHNRGAETCRLVIFLVGAHHARLGT